MAYETLFEDRGWTDTYYRDTKLFVWEHPDYPGLMIDSADDGEDFAVFAGDPLTKGKYGQLTKFEDPEAAIAFCERIAPLADWPKATQWTPSPTLDKQLHAIALDITGMIPQPGRA